MEKYSWLLYSLMSKGDKKYLSVLIHPDLTLNTVDQGSMERSEWLIANLCGEDVDKSLVARWIHPPFPPAPTTPTQ